MRRKNRKWLATAVVVYLFVMWSAYRWGIAQRIPEGNIFNKIEHEGIKKLADERAKAAADVPKPSGESRLLAAGQAFVAARYDATHVVFMVTAETESRFSNSRLLVRSSGTPTRVSPPLKPAAPLAGLQELWEPDPQAVHFFPEVIQRTQTGERWTLSVSPDSTISAAIDRVVVAPMGCSLALGFLASVPPEQQAAFAASGREYFAVRRNAVALFDPPVVSNIGELQRWNAAPAMAKQIEQQLNDRMKVEVSEIDARLMANAGSPGAVGESPMGARPRLKEWIHADQGLRRGEGKLDYDIRAFRLTPDGVPRLFVRARWKLAESNVFLMTAWFRADTPNLQPPSAIAQPLMLFVDSSWSTLLRQGKADGSLGDSLNFQTILNEFDADRDGWAELLLHSDQSDSTAITLYLYTDLGLVPMKTPLRRDAQTPESCIDQSAQSGN